MIVNVKLFASAFSFLGVSSNVVIRDSNHFTLFSLKFKVGILLSLLNLNSLLSVVLIQGDNRFLRSLVGLTLNLHSGLLVDLDLHLSSLLSLLQGSTLSVLSLSLMRSSVSLITFDSFASELVDLVGLLDFVSKSRSQLRVLNSLLFFGKSLLNDGNRLLLLIVHSHIFEQIFNHYKFDYFSGQE